MSKYIDADKLCKGLKDMAKYQEPYKQSTILGVVSTIENTPTADVVEVKHGYWKLHKNGSGTCDRCRITQKNVWDSHNWQNYCGHCGAKMDLKKVQNNA